MDMQPEKQKAPSTQPPDHRWVKNRTAKEEDDS